MDLQKSETYLTLSPFASWPQVFVDDERLAGALLDRLTHHVHVIEILAPSFRLNATQASGISNARLPKTISTRWPAVKKYKITGVY
ncbi:MAG: hypothetical protein A2Y07_05240 [Planctomycetes bacterium GWF2_50_10]|nr:MAG: hypothetical protein A2Y07_05240 [Planctomycetes bacterium GWF2_50_10]